MHIILGLIGIAISVALIVYREQVGNMLGEPTWADKVGGIYNVVVIIAIFFFFWSLAFMTGTQDVLFSPLMNILPQRKNPGAF